jgi:ribonuclease HII
MPDYSIESEILRAGTHPVAGIDEAGRGPLAGPVVAAAVVLPDAAAVPGLDDSKKLSASKREALYLAITSCPGGDWAVGMADCAEIDRLNILRATHLAMARAAAGLKSRPAIFLIDGLPVPGFPHPSRAIIKGDSISLSIAAASIIAKVTRDREMAKLDAEYPAYGFAKHQGYGTREHLAALQRHGPCPHHRRSFRPVSQLELPFDKASG